MTRVRAAGRLIAVVLAYTARIWFEDRHRRNTVAYIDKTRALGTTGRTTRAYREQDIDE